MSSARLLAPSPFRVVRTEREKLIGSRSADCIKASGHMRRINRPHI